MDTEAMKHQDAGRAGEARASAPCRIDMGGTLDIDAFYLPLRRLAPVTFNIALDYRTHVAVRSYRPGKIRIASRGFESVAFHADKLPFDHPLGLMLAIVAYYDGDGLEIRIDSESPPRSGLGGSSSAAVALIAALELLRSVPGRRRRTKRAMALLAHAVESSVAGVPCGLQDQLAAVYGGVNAWLWPGEPGRTPYVRQPVSRPGAYRGLEEHLLLAYCGSIHESKQVNSRWVRGFLTAERRKEWAAITDLARRFVRAVGCLDMAEAARCMNAETDIRREMTPEVLNPAGEALVAAARTNGCGGRFTGAGGGGCIWAIGLPENIGRLRKEWGAITAGVPDAKLLDARIARRGVHGALSPQALETGRRPGRSDR